MINMKDILPKRKSLSKIKLIKIKDMEDIAKKKSKIEDTSSEVKKIDDVIIH